jgi:hypothetical protein
VGLRILKRFEDDFKSLRMTLRVPEFEDDPRVSEFKDNSKGPRV